METEEQYMLRTGLNHRPPTVFHYNPRFERQIISPDRVRDRMGFSIHGNQQQRRTEVIDLKKFDKKKVTKPSDELSAGDIGSLVKIITQDGVEISDVLVQMVVHRVYNPDSDGVILVRFEHVGGEFAVNFGMRTVVQRPLPEE